MSNIFDIVTARADYELGALVIIDQTQLPEREVYLALKTPEEIWEAIYLLKVRGAPAIGVAAAYGISVCMQKVDEVDDFYREFARVKNYLASLETYRYGAEQIENVRKRKQEFARLFGDKLEEEWQALLKGEWGKGTLSYDASRKQEEGIVVVHVKAGSLARGLLEKMLKTYASKSGTSETSLYRSFALDKDKKVSYFKMPVPDFAGVMWGYVLGGIACLLYTSPSPRD